MTINPAVDRAYILRKTLQYLENQNSVLFGEFFDISDDDGLAKCANWLTDIMLEIADQSEYAASIVIKQRTEYVRKGQTTI